MIRVLLADQHRLLHSGIRAILSNSPKLTLTGTATESSQLQQLCSEHPPDIVLLALNIADPLHSDIVYQLQQYCPAAAILILLDNADAAPLRQLQEQGVAGAVLKTDPPEKLIEAILAAANGETWFSAPLLLKLLQPETEESPELTKRETAVLRLLVAEKTAEEIGQALSISERTVRSHLTSIYGKLGVKSKSGAIREAVRLNLFPEE